MPKLIMTLVVRDEEDILPLQLAYHRAQGVDFFLVLNHRSVDQTPEILQHFQDLGWLQFFNQSSLQRHQGPWVTGLARRAYLEHQADWVINNDADEFWWSDQGDLKTVLMNVPAAYRLVVARRHNWVLAPGQSPFWQRCLYRQQQSTNFLGEPLSSKLCHRGEAEIVVHHGNHSVAGMQADDFWPDQQAFEIFHIPVRGFAQFERKVRNGGASWAANPLAPPSVGRGKRYLYAHYLDGQLAQDYQRWNLSDAQLQTALSEGELVKDPRFSQFVSGLDLDL